MATVTEIKEESELSQPEKKPEVLEDGGIKIGVRVIYPPQKVLDVSKKQDRSCVKTIKDFGQTDYKPSVGDRVHIHFEAFKLQENGMTGEKIFSTRDPPRQYSMVLGQESNIKGLDLAARQMWQGEVARVMCKGDYMGTEDNELPFDLMIPRGEERLMYEIELLKWDMHEDISLERDQGMFRCKQHEGDAAFDPPEMGATCCITIECHANGKIFFEAEKYEFEIGKAKYLNLPKGLDVTLRQMEVGERSLIFINSRYYGFKRGNKEYGLRADDPILMDITLHSFKAPRHPDDIYKEQRIMDAQKCKEKGMAFFNAGKYRDAKKSYEKMVSLLATLTNCSEDKEMDETIKEIGGAQYDQMMEAELAAYGFTWDPFQKERDVLYGQALNNLALAYIRLNDPGSAIRTCNKALNEKPSNIKALYRRGQAKLTQNLFNQARLDFEKILILRPEHEAAQMMMEKADEAEKEKEKRDQEEIAKYGKVIGSKYGKRPSTFKTVPRERMEGQNKPDPDDPNCPPLPPGCR